MTDVYQLFVDIAQSSIHLVNLSLFYLIVLVENKSFRLLRDRKKEEKKRSPVD